VRLAAGLPFDTDESAIPLLESDMNMSNRTARLGLVALTLGALATLAIGQAFAADAETEPTSKPALPVKVDVKLSSQKLKPGQACTAKVTVRNTSSSIVFVKGGKRTPDIQPACWRRGERIVVTSGKYATEGGQLTLKPGESATATLDLTAMYKLQTPGQYLFSATVQFSTEELGGPKEQDRIWLPSFREVANFTVSAD
jgi:hypothetical protein